MFCLMMLMAGIIIHKSMGMRSMSLPAIVHATESTPAVVYSSDSDSVSIITDDDLVDYSVVQRRSRRAPPPERPCSGSYYDNGTWKYTQDSCNVLADRCQVLNNGAPCSVKCGTSSSRTKRQTKYTPIVHTPPRQPVVTHKGKVNVSADTDIYYLANNVTHRVPLEDLHIEFKDCIVKSISLPGKKITVHQFYSMIVNEVIKNKNYKHLFGPLDAFSHSQHFRDPAFATFFLDRIAMYEERNPTFRSNLRDVFAAEIGCTIADKSVCSHDHLQHVIYSALDLLKNKHSSKVYVETDFGCAIVSSTTIHFGKSCSPTTRLRTSELASNLPAICEIVPIPFLHRSHITAPEFLQILGSLNATDFDEFAFVINKRIRAHDTHSEAKEHLTLSMKKKFVIEDFFPSRSNISLNEVKGASVLMNDSDCRIAIYSVIFHREKHLVGTLSKKPEDSVVYYYPKVNATEC
ncbi:ORF3 [Adelphocoris suturalis virus]|uniref:ORF3 n=1 Tax=Adelphocoris suturalis virus TaxID=1930920 RepID=UPI00095084B9|nr:ORF3 [Adelphocoris suturalis virus]APT35495.1 ORF3 [Adelphocoris suturalis virus]